MGHMNARKETAVWTWVPEEEKKKQKSTKRESTGKKRRKIGRCATPQKDDRRAGIQREKKDTKGTVRDPEKKTIMVEGGMISCGNPKKNICKSGRKDGRFWKRKGDGKEAGTQK